MYRIILNATLNNAPTKMGSNFRPLGEDAKAELPQIEEMSRVIIFNNDIKINTSLYPGIKMYVADKNFFTYFNFLMKEGDPNSALSGPGNVVISESAAKKYFPGQNAFGQQLNCYGNDFTITGIMKDMPKNSSLQSDFIFAAFGEFLEHTWGGWDGYITFVTLLPGTDIKQTEESLKQIAYRGVDFYKRGGVYFTLEPLKDMHFTTGFLMESIGKGNKSLIMVFVLVAFVILIISCINFTNLFISTSFLRAKSIGIKKSQGAVRSYLIREFYTETVYYVLISIVVGILLTYLILPVFNTFTQVNLTIDFLSPVLYLLLFGLLIVTVLLAGSVPALYMTNFNPVQTLGGKFKGRNISFFQKSLIITQFAASIALLIVVAFMQKQVKFMVNHDLGFDKENVIYVYGRGNFCSNYKAFRDEMMKNPSIVDVTLKNSLPTEWRQGWGLGNVGSQDLTIMEINQVESNYFDFMNMQIIEGENPFHLESSDSIAPVIINESALKLLGLESPVGQIIGANGGNQKLRIKGIMRNANIRSLREDIDPQVYMKNDYYLYRPVFFKITGDPQRAIDVIRSKWQELEHDYPFVYRFLDDTYKELYISEMNAQKIFSYAMLITAIISIAGLFAMAFYVTQRRIKEIGLRKINGATLKDLLLLLNKDFVVWITISFCIAAPVAYFALQSWLEGFKVKTSLSIWIFILAGIIALAVTLLTTSFQTWKIATTNPIKTLKSE